MESRGGISHFPICCGLQLTGHMQEYSACGVRKSILHAEFDKKPGKEVKCRIGGNVIKMGVGELLYS